MDLVFDSLVLLHGVALQQGDHDRARELYDQSLELVRANPGAGARYRSVAQTNMRLLGDERWAGLVEERLKLLQAQGDRARSAGQLLQLAMVARNAGDYGRATALASQSLAEYRDNGERLALARALQVCGRLALDQGAYTRAIERCEEALTLARQDELRDVMAISLLILSDIAIAQGKEAEAVRLCEEALCILRDLGNRWLASFALKNLALAARIRGDPSRAQQLIEESLDMVRRSHPEGTAEIMLTRGPVALDLGETGAAEAAFAESLRFFAEHGPFILVPPGVEGLAAVAVRRHEWERAARLLGAAATLRRQRGTPVTPVNQPFVAQQSATASAALGEEAYRQAWSEGQRMTVEQAAAYALEPLSRA